MADYGPWDAATVASVEHMRAIRLSPREAEAILRRTTETVERLYPDFPFHVEPESLDVCGRLGLDLGPDLHDEGPGRVLVAAGDYDRVGDLEAALLRLVLDYLDGQPWRDPDVMANLAGADDPAE